jgi:hypothetical protein
LKRFSLSLSLGVAIAAFSAAAALAQPVPNITGNWTVEQSGPNGTASSTITMTQTGNTFVGKNPKTGVGFTGKYCTPDVDKGCTSALQIDGKWNGPPGAGWITVYVTPNGHSMNGSWGYNGRKENGTFVGNMILPPIKITTAGTWNMTVVTGPTLFQGPTTCTESGPTSICQVSNLTLNGKFRTSDKVRYTWTSKTQTGWFSFWFNDDGQSFNGIWGYGPATETSPTIGRVVGQRVGPPARQ